ncbi:MAG TPA: LptA/OstA family protein [Caulobacteraceae bacterium]|nr:LptA/OstA family protein [Caulobacteraceae bacterium]
MRRPLAFLIPLAAIGLTPAAARAQLAPSSSAPVDVTADRLDVESSQCVARWHGDAEALQGTSRLRADTLNIYNKLERGKASGDAGAGPRSNCGPLDRFEADGSVYYVTPNQVVKGDHAVYVADAKTITVTGQVVATQGKNVIVGQKLVVNTDTGEATMESEAKGRGQAGRPRAVIYTNGTQSGDPFAAGPRAKP